jgi:hypothetical protein
MVGERNDVMTNGPVCHESLSCTKVSHRRRRHPPRRARPDPTLLPRRPALATGSANPETVGAVREPPLRAGERLFLNGADVAV